MSLYLTRLTLNVRSRQAQRDLSSPYEMHRTLMRAFPGEEGGGAGRVLFRLEEGRAESPGVVLVQSEKKPDWAFLQALPGYLDESGGGSPEVKQFDPRLHPGQSLRFRLRANPTMRRSSDKRRLGLFKEEDQLKWLQRKGEAGGFEVRVCRALPKGHGPIGHVKAAEGNQTITMHAVLFEGVLRITDPAAFEKALSAGIGSGKGMGFGLLSVGPYQEAED